MKTSNKHFIFILFSCLLSLSFILSGCETILGSLFTGTISSNRTLQNRKNFNQQMIDSREISSNDEDEYDILARKRGVIIEKLDNPNTTGSLSNPQDPRNNLFLSKDPNFIGQYLDVKVVFNRKSEEDSKESATKTNTKTEETETDPELEAILQMLPTLSPADPNLVVLQTIKMQVTQIYPNGDVSVSLRRSSKNDAESYDFIVNARIPYDKLNRSKSQPLSTQDLVDVKWFENDNSYISEKYSSIWEDEYSLRLSGFKETKSKYALELEDKEDQLKKAKKALEAQIYSFKQEKKKFNKMQEKASNSNSNTTSNSNTSNKTDTDNKDNDLKPKSI